VASNSRRGSSTTRDQPATTTASSALCDILSTSTDDSPSTDAEARALATLRFSLPGFTRFLRKGASFSRNHLGIRLGLVRLGRSGPGRWPFHRKILTCKKMVRAIKYCSIGSALAFHPVPWPKKINSSPNLQQRNSGGERSLDLMSAQGESSVDGGRRRLCQRLRRQLEMA
jgi:hypothetical protein